MPPLPPPASQLVSASLYSFSGQRCPTGLCEHGRSPRKSPSLMWGLPQLPGRKRAWAFQPEKLRHRDPCIHQPVAQTPFPKHVDLETSSNSTATSRVGHLANPRAGFCYSYFVDEGPEVQRRKETCPTLIERGGGKMMFRPRRGRAAGARSLASYSSTPWPRPSQALQPNQALCTPRSSEHM